MLKLARAQPVTIKYPGARLKLMHAWQLQTMTDKGRPLTDVPSIHTQ